MFRIFLLLGLSFWLVSCKSVSDIPTKEAKAPAGAQAQAIRITRAFQYGGKLVLKEYNLPAGRYALSHSDTKGDFYQAPSELKVRDFPLYYTIPGGVYWKRGEAKPTTIYIKAKVLGVTKLGGASSIPFGGATP